MIHSNEVEGEIAFDGTDGVQITSPVVTRTVEGHKGVDFSTNVEDIVAYL